MTADSAEYARLQGVVGKELADILVRCDFLDDLIGDLVMVDVLFGRKITMIALEEIRKEEAMTAYELDVMTDCLLGDGMQY